MNNKIPGEFIPVPVPSQADQIAEIRKRKARRRLAIIVGAVVILGAAAWYFQKSFSLPIQSVSSFENSISSQLQSGLNFTAPSPSLKSTSIGAAKKANTLTQEGVIAQTNIQRNENGNLPALVENETLDDIAMLRLDDMFQQQYFAHVGPQQESAITVASSVGYSYLALGENLALGNFAGDTGVLTAWMNSPGHRANILDPIYTQIGVAVREGIFQGQNTWLAVQVFGKPSSACPAPDTNLKSSIDLSETQLSTMSAELQQDKAQIAAMQPQAGASYNEQVEDYNNLVAQYNNLGVSTKTAIAQYDAEVTAFNSCLVE